MSEFEFKIGNPYIQYLSMYRYLGINLHEHLNFSSSVDTMSKAGGRALGAIISNIQYYNEYK